MFPPKYFYDAAGSRLFDRICEVPEYYPTRAEDALLADHALTIIDRARPKRILELGSGTSRKTRHLLDACAELGVTPTYQPLDVCKEILVDTGQRLVNDYEWLKVDALVGDYQAGLDGVGVSDIETLFVFLGSTLGNLDEQEATDLLAEIHSLMQPDDRLLLGLDRVKDPNVLHGAYNDAQGITARFNLNVLNVINRELDADFQVGGFDHYACYNPDLSRIEMYLVARQAQDVAIKRLGRTLNLAEGEPILTEVSRKYTSCSIEELMARSGFVVERHFQLPAPRFSLVVARPDAAT